MRLFTALAFPYAEIVLASGRNTAARLEEPTTSNFCCGAVALTPTLPASVIVILSEPAL